MRTHPALRSTVAIVLCAAASALVAGCGGSSAASDTSTASTRDAARVKFAQCLRQHGIDIPDNPGQGAGRGALATIDRSKLQAAQKACQKFQQAAVGEISDAQRQEFQDAFAKFASCMRQQGVELPTFTPGSGPPPAGGARINRDDPKVQAAQKACQGMLPQGGPGSFGGPGGPQGGQ